jgi:hypothetical protein
MRWVQDPLQAISADPARGGVGRVLKAGCLRRGRQRSLPKAGLAAASTAFNRTGARWAATHGGHGGGGGRYLRHESEPDLARTSTMTVSICGKPRVPEYAPCSLTERRRPEAGDPYQWPEKFASKPCARSRRNSGDGGSHGGGP